MATEQPAVQYVSHPMFACPSRRHIAHPGWTCSEQDALHASILGAFDPFAVLTTPATALAGTTFGPGARSAV